MVWAYLGDALWILALTIMFGGSRQAARSVPRDARPPIVKIPTPRAIFLWALPASAFLFSLALVVASRRRAHEGDLALLVFGVRALSASLLAMLHLRWLAAGLKALERDGVLKP